MKLAIIGQGPGGLEAALHFHALEAEIKIFHRTDLAGGLELVSSFPLGRCWSEVTSILGRDLLIREGDARFGDNDFLGQVPTADQYVQSYLKVLQREVEKWGVSRVANVSRVHKRFLGTSETPLTGSRLKDLFRVVYWVEPDQAAIDAAPESLKASLAEKYEAFEDFDCVIDATGTWSAPKAAGPGGVEAVGEDRVRSKGNLFYGTDCWRYLLENQESLSNQKVAVVSDHYLGVALTLALYENLGGSGHISLVTPWKKETGPLEWSYRSDFQWLNQRFEETQNQLGELARKREADHQVELEKWQALEDYEKVKIKKPVLATEALRSYLSTNATAIDSLDDREGVFVTLESPDFRTEEDQLEVVNFDRVFVINGLDKNLELYQGLLTDWEKKGPTHPEPGFYSLVKKEDEDFGLHAVVDAIQIIEKDLGNYFVRGQ